MLFSVKLQHGLREVRMLPSVTFVMMIAWELNFRRRRLFPLAFFYHVGEAGLFQVLLTSLRNSNDNFFYVDGAGYVNRSS